MNHPPLKSDWSIGEHAFRRIVELAPKPVTKILEFGSGVSTVRLLQAFPKATITSYEHSQEFFFETHEMLKRYKVKERCDLVLYPPHITDIALKISVSRCRGADLCIVDGPPSAYADGRERMGLAGIPMVRPGGLIVCDDYRRPGEQKAVARWREEWPDLRFQHERVGHGLGLLWKPKEK